MGLTRYKNSNLTRHIWLCLALFFLVFNSTPVKRFIKLHLYMQYAPVDTDNPQQISSSLIKDCTLIERHTSAPGSMLDMQQHVNDTDVILFLSALAASFILFAPVDKRLRFRILQGHAGNDIPAYLQTCKLQV